MICVSTFLGSREGALMHGHSVLNGRFTRLALLTVSAGFTRCSAWLFESDYAHLIDRLVRMNRGQTGRVALSSFFGAKSQHYLSALGVLDYSICPREAYVVHSD